MNTSSSHFPTWFKSISHAASVTVILVVACMACSAPPTPAPQFALRIGVYSVPAYQPYFVMQAQGFDKQNGLQLVEKTPFAGGAAVIEAMAAGSVDVGYIGSVPVLTAAQSRLIPSTVVPVAANDFADPDHQSVGVLAAPSINSWKDLAGQSIAVNSVNSIQGAAIKGRLQQEGVKGYTLVEISFANMGLAVAGGNVAAATMVEPFLTQSLSRGDGKLLGWIIGGTPFERLEVTLLVFSADFYRNNPEAVKAFLRAQLQAVKWINQNPALARSILTKRLTLNEEVGQQMTLTRWLLDGRNDPALLESMQPLLVEVGILKAPIPARQLYDETLLDQVLAEKR
ncbi:MAG: ABC transporter substrate-binding protein [Chloroflexi bacterium]|nr:ABC transporter substrate-binding protein [Chloroflexota bacterium]